MGITAVSVEAFRHSDLPGPLPWTYLPGCGQGTPEQYAQAWEQFEATKRAGHAPPLEPGVVEAVMQCVQWTRHAESRPGLGIIGFSS
ncbi:hypothetical protein AB0M69_12795 [Streptomyces syringium]